MTKKRELRASTLTAIGTGIGDRKRRLGAGHSSLWVNITAMDAATVLKVYALTSPTEEDFADIAFLEITHADFLILQAFQAPIHEPVLDDIACRYEVTGGNVTFEVNQVFYDSMAG